MVNSVASISKTKEKKQNKSNVKVIYKDVRYTIIQPLDKDASCAYGTGTKWCISATKTKNHYDEYNEKGIQFYFIIDKSIPVASNIEDEESIKNFSKVAIAYHPDAAESTEIYDSKDQVVTKKEFMSLYPKEILDVLNNLMDNQFMPPEETARNAANIFLRETSSLTLKEVKQFLRASTPDNIDRQDEESESRQIYEMKMDILIKEIPLKLLPALYSPDGGESTLQNLGFEHLFQQRLEKENLSVDEIFQMFEMSVKLYRITEDEYGYSRSAYQEYLSYGNLDLESLKKMIEFNPFGWEYPPFKSTAITKYLGNVAREVGIKQGTEEFIELRNFMNSASERKFIKRMSELLLLSPDDPEKQELVDMLFQHKERSTISTNTLKKMAEIYRSGKLNNLFTPLFGQEFSF